MLKKIYLRLSLFDKLYIVLTIFFLFFFARLVSISSFDFSDGHYLYISWRLLQGDMPYRDFLVPHPPVLYILGALLMKIHNSVYFIRYFNLFLFLLSNFLLYRLTFKLFKNKLSALICSVLYFILPTSGLHVLFMPEMVLRLIVLLCLNVFMPSNLLTRRKIYLLVLLSLLGMFTKYSFLPIVGAMGLMLMFVKRKYFFLYLGSLIIFTLSIILILQVVTRGEFIINTLIVRKDIPLKPFFVIKDIIKVFVVRYGMLLIFSTIISYLIFSKKNRDIIFCSLITLFSLPAFSVILYFGTESYIFYPTDIFLLLLPSVLIAQIFSRNKYFNIDNSFKKITIKVLLFFVVLTFFFYLGSFIERFDPQNTSLMISKNVGDVNKVNSYIKKYSRSSDEILSFPYFNYLSDRKITDNYSELFLYMIDYNMGIKRYLKRTNVIIDKIKRGAIPVIVTYHDLLFIKPINDEIEKHYLQVYFSEDLDTEVYIPLKDRGNVNSSTIADNQSFGVGFSELNNNKRKIRAYSEFYFSKDDKKQLNVKMKLNQDLPYPIFWVTKCNGIIIKEKAVIDGSVQNINADIQTFSGNLLKCSFEMKSDKIENFRKSEVFVAEVELLEIN